MNPLHLGYDAARRPVRLDPDDRKTHMHVIGSSGSGKSKFLEYMIRGDLRNRQGFCLIDPHGTLYTDVLNFSAHHYLGRDIILLDLSSPTSIIGFNPFQRAEGADVSVQVDHRITATMHAWGVDNTDQTPTLERMLRLIYTVMIDQDLGLGQVQHLIDFTAGDVRSYLIERLESPLIQKEWQALQQLRAKDWRDETLSARNRLFRFLTSPALTRFMGLPGRTLDLREIMDQGKVLLVNLAPSDQLSEENARAFGALLINEFFETARRRRRDDRGRDPKPYFLYMDEFQNFVSLDIADMLDQVRKFGLFTILAHQRFGHLDENITDAVLTNCRIKAVFGGLPVVSARRMAEELFIGKLDPMKVKAAIYQTKFWPQYSRDKVYTSGTAQGRSTSRSSTSGGSDSHYSSLSTTDSAAYAYDDWFSLPQIAGTRTETTNRGSSSMSGSSSNWSESDTESDSTTESESVADIPIFIPVPFQELSSIQYHSLEEQLTELTRALKEQFPRHCFIKILSEETQPLLVPLIEEKYTSKANRQLYTERLLEKHDALPAETVDALIKERETALLQEAQAPRYALEGPVIDAEVLPLQGEVEPLPRKRKAASQPIWPRTPSKPK